MTAAHRWLGLALAGDFLLLFVWGIVQWARNRHPPPGFWWLLAAGQAGIALVALTGVVLLIAGGGRSVLHYAYGGFPALVLVFAHRASRRLEGLEWVAFSLAGLVNFGLILRGFMTGAA